MTEQRSELAHRSTDGIEVSLFWSRPTVRVTIEIVDGRLDERLEFMVAPDKALDAFGQPTPTRPHERFGRVRGDRIESPSPVRGNPQAAQALRDGRR
jgi:hypothetical protein